MRRVPHLRMPARGTRDPEPDGSESWRPIYLDYHATTPTDPRVADVVLHYLTTAFGNASSGDHSYGDEAADAVANARRWVGELVGAAPQRIVFTSGATESLNLAIQGLVRLRETRRSGAVARIALSRIEHRAVLDTCEALAESGRAELVWLPVDSVGQLDLDALADACTHGLDLVCAMAANNEIGTVWPLRDIGGIAARSGVPLLVDATQAAGKLPLQVEEWGIPLVALTAHKMYGPKGVGALVVHPDVPLAPLIHGGGHQRGLRSGTLNVPAIAGFGEACRLRLAEMREDEAAVASLRDTLQAALVSAIEGLVVNGDQQNRLSGNLHVSVPDVPNSVVVARVRHKLAIATGAACSSGAPAPSHVLRALGLPDGVVDGALRIGLGKFTTDEEVRHAAAILDQAVGEARTLMRASPPPQTAAGAETDVWG